VPNFSSQGGIDQFNEQLRAMPEYQEFLRSLGADPSGALRLTDSQRKQAERWVQSRFGDIGKLEIDPAGNVNQDEGFSRHKKWIIPAAVGVGTLGLGAAGVGPLAGIMGAGGGGTLASSSLPTASLMGGPAAASAGLSGAGLASSALPTAALMGGPAAASAGLSGASGASAAGGIGSRIASVAGSGAGSGVGGGSSLLKDILGTYVPIGLSGVQAVRGLTQGPPKAQQDIERLLKMAEGRVNQTQPLFDALNAMAMAQMPAYSRGGK
jgi:hypothetical protein